MDYEQLYLKNYSIGIYNRDRISFTGEFLNAPSKLEANVSLLSIKDGDVLSTEKKTYIEDGKVITNLTEKELGCSPRWLIIETKDKSPNYWILALAKGRPFEWPIGKDRELIQQFLNIDSVFLKLVYIDKDVSKWCDLKELSKPIIKELLSKRDFKRKSRYPVKDAELRWEEKECQIYLDLPVGGVVCTTCGRFFQNQNEWFKHTPFLTCKSMKARVKTIKAQLLCCLNFADLYNQFFKRFPMIENDAIILYDFDTRPLPRELQLTNLCNINLQALLEALLIGEIELFKRIMEVTDNEP